VIEITIENENIDEAQLLGEGLLGQLITFGNRQFLIVEHGLYCFRKGIATFRASGLSRQEWLDHLKNMPEPMADAQRERFKDWKR
jgi:hypothetical protein